MTKHYAILDQHKIKLDHKEDLICSFFKILQMLLKKKKDLHSEIRHLEKGHQCENAQGFCSGG